METHKATRTHPPSTPKRYLHHLVSSVHPSREGNLAWALELYGGVPPCLVRNPYPFCECPSKWTYQLLHTQLDQVLHSPEIHDLKKKGDVETRFKTETDHCDRKRIESEEENYWLLYFSSVSLSNCSTSALGCFSAFKRAAWWDSLSSFNWKIPVKKH